jgi:hypothetical protein
LDSSLLVSKDYGLGVLIKQFIVAHIFTNLRFL